MSSKNTKDKYEPITIETTILKINVKTTGDLLTKEYDLIPFHPNMADLRDLSNNSYILFPSFVKITQKDLQKAGLGSDYPKLFTNLDKYIQLIKYVTGPEKEDDPTLLIDKSQSKNALTGLLAENASDDIFAIQKNEPLTEAEIITNNIELIKSLFFPIRGRFFILGNEYVIGQSKYVAPYMASREINETLSKESSRKIPLAYTIKIELQLLDAVNNPEAGDFIKMSCKAKKGNLASDMKDIFGTNFGYVPEVKVTTPSILNTSAATQNRQFGKIQKEWEERNKYRKAPANERERKEMEAKWTPLQKKMADYDKAQDAFNKIPPLWLKETDALDKKYLDVKNELLKYWKELADIQESNPEESSFKKDILNAVKTKMNAALEELPEVLDEAVREANRAKADALTASLRSEKDADKKRELIAEQKYFKEYADALLAYDTLMEELAAKKEEYKLNKNEVANLDKNYKVELDALADKIMKLERIDAFLKKLEAYKSPAEEKRAEEVINAEMNSGLLFKRKEAEQKKIDDKYIDSLRSDAGLAEKMKDIESLKTKEAELIGQRATSDSYAAASINTQIASVQNNLRKKKADYEVMEKKYGEMVKNWKEARTKMKSLANSIETEKSKAEKELTNKMVKEELEKKMEFIKKEEGLYLIAIVKEGKEEEKTTKKEKEELDKKDRPIDTADTIAEEIRTMKEEYLELAGKRGFFYKVQAEIVFLSDYLKRLKDVLLKGVETDKAAIDRKIKEIDRTIEGILDRRGYITDQSRYDTLKNEQAEIKKEADAKNFTEKINKLKRKVKLYELYIKKLKAVPDTTEAKAKFTAFYNDYFTATLENLKKISNLVDTPAELKTFIEENNAALDKTPMVKDLGKEYLKLLEEQQVLEAKPEPTSKDGEKEKKRKSEEIEKKKMDITTHMERVINEIKSEIHLKADSGTEPTVGGKKHTRKHSRKYRPKKTKRYGKAKRKSTLRKKKNMRRRKTLRRFKA
jgi:hypothetical protein